MPWPRSLQEYLPMVIAVVEPEEAPSARLVANLVEVAVGDVAIGMPLEVVWEDAGDGVAVYRFRPADDGTPQDDTIDDNEGARHEHRIRTVAQRSSPLMRMSPSPLSCIPNDSMPTCGTGRRASTPGTDGGSSSSKDSRPAS